MSNDITPPSNRTWLQRQATGVTQPAWPALWVALLTALVVAPWFFPGYIFGTDFAGDRHFYFPTSISSYAGLQAALALVSKVLSAELTAKILISVSLLAGGVGAFRALPIDGFVPRAVASLVYVFNPFVYDRLLYGQLAVLAGYAMLPWVVCNTRQLIQGPKLMRTLLTAGSLTVLGILDLHMLLPAGLLMTCLLSAHAIAKRREIKHLLRLGLTVLGVGVGTVVASLYWLIPLLRGTNPQAKVLSTIGTADLEVFNAIPDHRLGLLPNLLGLYGFWAEATGRFASMKQFVPGWPLVLGMLLLLLVVAVLGAGIARIPGSGIQDRAWVWGLLVAGLLALCLEIGVADPRVGRIIQIITALFPPYRGMRDTAKWAAVLALVYSQLIPAGASFVFAWAARVPFGAGRETVRSALIALTTALPLYYGNGLLYGAHLQIQPSKYPAGWYSADATLIADQSPGRTVFLPWHLYMSLGFVKNANNVVQAPAPEFFSVPVVVSDDLEIRGVATPLDADQAEISRLVANGGRTEWAPALARRGIKYVLLAKEANWESYRYLNDQPGLLRVADYGTIILYRNLLMH